MAYLWTADTLMYQDISMDAAYSGNTLIWKKRLHSKRYQVISMVTGSTALDNLAAGDLLMFGTIDSNPYPNTFVANVISADPNYSGDWENTMYANSIEPTYENDGVTITDPNQQILVAEIDSVLGNIQYGKNIRITNYYEPTFVDTGGTHTNYITYNIYRNKYGTSTYDSNDYSGSLFKTFMNATVYVETTGLLLGDDGTYYHLASQSVYDSATTLYSQTRFMHDQQVVIPTPPERYANCYVFKVKEV